MGAQPAEVRASGGFATQTFSNNSFAEGNNSFNEMFEVIYGGHREISYDGRTKNTSTNFLHDAELTQVLVKFCSSQVDGDFCSGNVEPCQTRGNKDYTCKSGRHSARAGITLVLPM